MSLPREHYPLPPVTTCPDGSMRRVGFELEFTGLHLKQVVDVLCECFDGELIRHSAVEYSLHSAGLGEFRMELDWQFLKRRARQQQESGQQVEEAWLDWLHKVASQVVPLEVVCPPIALDQLAELNPMVAALRQAGALGTDEQLFFAFGVHINPELPDTRVDTIIRYLKAYSLLQPWLVQIHQVDLMRRLSPYVNLYSDAYRDLVLGYPEHVPLSRLIDDYLQHNPTRNRALDMLPLFAYLDEARVRARVDDPRIKARPTFHYRLPNCQVQHQLWSLAQVWQPWWLLERLSGDARALAQLIDAYWSHRNKWLGGTDRGWKEEISRWLSDHGWW